MKSKLKTWFRARRSILDLIGDRSAVAATIVSMPSMRPDAVMIASSTNTHVDLITAAALAGKADGLILHDRMLSAVGIARLADMVPIVTLAGSPTSASLNVRCDNESGIRALVRHLVIDHGYRSLGYVTGRVCTHSQQRPPRPAPKSTPGPPGRATTAPRAAPTLSRRCWTPAASSREQSCVPTTRQPWA